MLPRMRIDGKAHCGYIRCSSSGVEITEDEQKTIADSLPEGQMLSRMRVKEKWRLELLGTRKGWELKIRKKKGEKYFIMLMKKREN